MFGNCRLIAQLIAMLCLGLNARSMAGSVSPDVSFMIADETGAWTSSELTYQIGEPMELPLIEDDSFTPAQMLSPQRPLGLQTAQRQQRPQNQQRESGLASVPFMIGDTGAGSCISFGGLLDVELAHPTMACSRLNISESNTPLPTDRLYFSYRHFHNATPTRFFQYEQDFNLDRYTLGGEKTFFNDMMSFEMRLPLEHRLTSQPFTYDVLNPPFFLDPVAFPPGFVPLGGGTRTELGNVSFILKALLMERSNFALSAGLGVTLPTAQDVQYLITTDDTLVFPSIPGLEADSSVLLDVFVSNETVYLSPFLSWLWQPRSRFFHQGFLQIEVAANPSSVVVAGDGYNDFYFNNVFLGTLDWRTPFPTGRTDLFAQTLMRLNLGCGYKLFENPAADFLQQLTAMFEVHYTSTLQDANISSIPVFVQGSLGTIPVQSLDFGNRLNRVDIVNVVAGLSAKAGNWVVTNGVAAPVKECRCSRGFDFEYNFQLQRPF
jgi:hypothetical protein